MAEEKELFELDLEENLPQLQSQFQSSDIRPKVKVYEGNTGLLQIWQDILSDQGEILLWTNQQTENQVFGDKNHERNRIPGQLYPFFQSA